MKWLSRLWLNPDGTSIKFSTHLFFYIAFMFGLAFVLPPQAFGLGVIELFKFSSIHNLSILWGLGLLSVTAINTIMLLTRSRILGSIVGVLGFSCWLYAAFAYFILGQPFGFLVVAVPNMLFWGWYTFRISYYRSYLDEHELSSDI